MLEKRAYKILLIFFLVLSLFLSACKQQQLTTQQTDLTEEELVQVSEQRVSPLLNMRSESVVTAIDTREKEKLKDSASRADDQSNKFGDNVVALLRFARESENPALLDAALRLRRLYSGNSIEFYTSSLSEQFSTGNVEETADDYAFTLNIEVDQAMELLGEIRTLAEDEAESAMLNHLDSMEQNLNNFDSSCEELRDTVVESISISDFDGDGVLDNADTDFNGDGVNDDVSGDGVLSSEDFDLNGDSVVDTLDFDADENGLNDFTGEVLPIDFDPLSDWNQDGVKDVEVEEVMDGIGVTNALIDTGFTDTDGDGFIDQDEYESQSGDVLGDGDIGIEDVSYVYDGNVDYDNDGLTNWDDDDADGDGAINLDDTDINGNGVDDLSEWDFDGDGDIDGDDFVVEIAPVGDVDYDDDGLTNWEDDDADGDGAINLDDTDINGDDVLDEEEISIEEQILDVSDYSEDSERVEENYGSPVDTDSDDIPDYEDPDCDNDGVLNHEDPDDDEDGITDAVEVYTLERVIGGVDVGAADIGTVVVGDYYAILSGENEEYEDVESYMRDNVDEYRDYLDANPEYVQTMETYFGEHPEDKEHYESFLKANAEFYDTEARYYIQYNPESLERNPEFLVMPGVSSYFEAEELPEELEKYFSEHPEDREHYEATKEHYEQFREQYVEQYGDEALSSQFESVYGEHGGYWGNTDYNSLYSTSGEYQHADAFSQGYYVGGYDVASGSVYTGYTSEGGSLGGYTGTTPSGFSGGHTGGETGGTGGTAPSGDGHTSPSDGGVTGHTVYSRR